MVDIGGADGGGPVFHNKQINRTLMHMDGLIDDDRSITASSS